MITEAQNQLIQMIRAHNIGGALVSGGNSLLILLYGAMFGIFGLIPSSSAEGASVFAGFGLIGLIVIIIGLLTFVPFLIAIILSIFIKRRSKWIWYMQLSLLIIGSLNIFMFYTMPISIYLLIKYSGQEYRDYYLASEFVNY